MNEEAMQVILVEDSGWKLFRPLTWLRSAGDLLIGAHTNAGAVGAGRKDAPRSSAAGARLPRSIGAAASTRRRAIRSAASGSGTAGFPIRDG